MLKPYRPEEFQMLLIEVLDFTDDGRPSFSEHEWSRIPIGSKVRISAWPGSNILIHTCTHAYLKRMAAG